LCGCSRRCGCCRHRNATIVAGISGVAYTLTTVSVVLVACGAMSTTIDSITAIVLECNIHTHEVVLDCTTITFQITRWLKTSTAADVGANGAIEVCAARADCGCVGLVTSCRGTRDSHTRKRLTRRATIGDSNVDCDVVVLLQLAGLTCDTTWGELSVDSCRPQLVPSGCGRSDVCNVSSFVLRALISVRFASLLTFYSDKLVRPRDSRIVATDVSISRNSTSTVARQLGGATACAFSLK